jgi:hypothetical protein
MTNITAQELDTCTLLTDSALVWAKDNLEYLNKPMRFFGSSLKVEKGSDKRDTYVMYLQPSNKVSKATLCAGANSAGCEKPCLISSGQLGMGVAQRAATKRTILLLLRPLATQAALLCEIDKAERKAIKTGTPALFRLNGTSDIDFGALIAQRPHSAFYDYTKVLSRVRKNTLPNYDLTFSASMYSTQSRAALKKAVMRKHKIAVAFNTKGLVSDNVSAPSGLVSFDDTDLRPLDTPSSIGYLSRKGSNKVQRAQEGERSFFVTQDNLTAFNDIIARG